MHSDGQISEIYEDLIGIGREAVARVAEHLYDPAGGGIAQFEFGIGINPETSLVIFEEWERWEREHRD